MDQWVAMVTMVVDHAWGGQYVWAHWLGRLAMAIYAYRQSHSRRWERVVVVAVVAELGFAAYAGQWGNVCWLFAGVSMVRTGHLIPGWLALGYVLGLHPWWGVWVPCLLSSDRRIWYGIHGVLGLLDPAGWVTLLGYELARARPWRQLGPPQGLWWAFYPAHWCVLIVVERLYF